MTRQQFMQLLKQSSEKHPEYRPIFTQSGHSRLRLVSEKRFCPITFVCYCEHGKYFDEGHYASAADLLELDYETIRDIVDGADRSTLGTHSERVFKAQTELAEALGIRDDFRVASLILH